MKTKDKEKKRKIDLVIKIILIIIIILLLIHNCVLQKNNKKPCQDIDIIDIDCKDGQCNVAPTPTPMQIVGIAFSQEKISIKKGESLDLIVRIYPSDLSDTKLTWISSDPSVVSVDENGQIVGLKTGRVTITVSTPNGKTATCIVEVVKDSVPVKSITLVPSKVTIKDGSSSQIIAIIKPENATNRNLVWSSSDDKIATVNSKGIVKGLKPGTVTITAKTKDGKVVAISEITIEAKPTPTPMQIESLSFAQKNVSIKKGDTLNLIVTVNPSELSSSKFTWSSNDNNIVKVDDNGVIKGINVGKATITVISSNGKTATCVVEVTTDTISVEKINLSPSEVTVKPGSVIQISATVEPENATDREIIWSSSDPKIATVDSNGVVKGLKSGKVTITAKTKDGKVIATSEITIEVPTTPTPTPTSTPMQIESLSFAQQNVSIKKNDTLKLIVTVIPSELSSSNLIWSSSDNSVVTVNNDGVITGINVGTATITVKSSNGKKATCTVEVTTNTIPVEEIELTPTSLTLNVGDSSQIIAVIKPENATDREIIWTSSNPSVVTVNDNGVINAVSAGTAIITVKTKDGKVVSTSEITVIIPSTPTPTPSPTPTPTGFNVYDNDKPPVTWNGSSDLKIFTNSLNGPVNVIAPESKNTYEFRIKNSTEYIMKYSIKFDEINDYHINMKYKLKKNDTYIVDHYVSCNELSVIDQLVNSNSEDVYYLEWYWQSNENDTDIGANPSANYSLSIKVEAESVNG